MTQPHRHQWLRKEVVRLCSEAPRTLKQLAELTGATPRAVSHTVYNASTVGEIVNLTPRPALVGYYIAASGRQVKDQRIADVTAAWFGRSACQS